MIFVLKLDNFEVAQNIGGLQIIITSLLGELVTTRKGMPLPIFHGSVNT